MWFNFKICSLGLIGKHELTIMPELFYSEPYVKKWKIDFNVITTSSYSGKSFGRSSLIIGIKQLPTNGSCSVVPLAGFSLFTIFSIECLNFTDPDGYIKKYEYFCNFYYQFFLLIN